MTLLSLSRISSNCLNIDISVYITNINRDDDVCSGFPSGHYMFFFLSFNYCLLFFARCCRCCCWHSKLENIFFFFWSSLLFFLNQALWFRRVLLFLIGFHFFLLVCLFICDCFRIWSKWKNLVFISSSCCCCCLIVTISLRFFPFYFFTQNPEYEIFLCIEYFAKL